MKVKKAIILAAGLGTRMLPATKSVPKELFPIVDKPALQYLVEELVHSGITDIMIVISRGKTLIEDHFDRSPELEERLIAGGEKKADVYKRQNQHKPQKFRSCHRPFYLNKLIRQIPIERRHCIGNQLRQNSRNQKDRTHQPIQYNIQNRISGNRKHFYKQTFDGCSPCRNGKIREFKPHRMPNFNARSGLVQTASTRPIAITILITEDPP